MKKSARSLCKWELRGKKTCEWQRAWCVCVWYDENGIRFMALKQLDCERSVLRQAHTLHTDNDPFTDWPTAGLTVGRSACWLASLSSNHWSKTSIVGIFWGRGGGVVCHRFNLILLCVVCWPLAVQLQHTTAIKRRQVTCWCFLLPPVPPTLLAWEFVYLCHHPILTCLWVIFIRRETLHNFPFGARFPRYFPPSSCIYFTRSVWRWHKVSFQRLVASTGTCFQRYTWRWKWMAKNIKMKRYSVATDSSHI